MKRAVVWMLLTCLVFGLTYMPSLGQDTQDNPRSSSPSYIRSSRLGITNISLAETQVSEARYDSALSLGAGWNRWPLYWDRVEAEPGAFQWRDYDRLVQDDIAYGLNINVILLGRPAFAQDGARIRGLHGAIFSDSSDTPREGKTINPRNLWANFVYEAVTRYKPGGTLAQAAGWTDDSGIRVWEIWNEPDYKPFWEGSILDYARLLKTAYLVIKMVDPEAQVMFGGLLYSNSDNWLARVLAIYEHDPFHEQYNWYMDLIGVHSYGYPWRSAWLVLVIQQTLKAYKIDRAIWMNESGAPVWDDYPGPTWETNPARRLMRVTEQQQAYYFIQSTAYAWAQGAAVVFFHQLFDDCGNQPAGTDFPAHDGELCDAGGLCSGDAFGLYRNERGSVCFSQHPEPGTARMATRAFRLMASLLGRGTLTNPTIQVLDNRATVITFDRPDTRQRLYVVWNQTLDPVEVNIPLEGKTGVMHSLDGQAWMIPDRTGGYSLTLPPAACDYYPELQYHEITAIGGSPIIVVTGLPEQTTGVAVVRPDTQPVSSRRTACKLPDMDITPTPGIDLLIPESVG